MTTSNTTTAEVLAALRRLLAQAEAQAADADDSHRRPYTFELAGIRRAVRTAEVAASMAGAGVEL